MKIPMDIEGSSYIGSVPCTITRVSIFGLMPKQGFLKAPSPCFTTSSRQFHTDHRRPQSAPSCDTPTDTPNMCPPSKGSHAIPQQIMMTYAEVVKSVSRHIPKQFSDMMTSSQTIQKVINSKPIIAFKMSPKTSSQNCYIQNSRCPWRTDNQRHSTPNKYNIPFVNKSFNNFHKVPELKNTHQRCAPKENIATPTTSSQRWKGQKSFRQHRPRNQNKFWQKSPQSSNWRSSSEAKCSSDPVMEQKAKVNSSKCAEQSSCKEVVKTPVVECQPELITFCDRTRRQSESSQASEDSWVVFERDSGCSYDSEISSQEDSETDSDSSDSESSEEEEEESETPLTDSGLTSDSELDDDHILQVGDSMIVSLPPRQRVPPPRLRSNSKSSSCVSEEESDSDDDFIVFQEESEEECDGPQHGASSAVDKGKQSTGVKAVRFAPKEEIFYFYDDDDHRKARCGAWEEIARDRFRFKARITSTAEVIAPILSQQHREKILKSRFS